MIPTSFPAAAARRSLCAFACGFLVIEADVSDPEGMQQRNDSELADFHYGTVSIRIRKPTRRTSMSQPTCSGWARSLTDSAATARTSIRPRCRLVKVSSSRSPALACHRHRSRCSMRQRAICTPAAEARAEQAFAGRAGTLVVIAHRTARGRPRTCGHHGCSDPWASVSFAPDRSRTGHARHGGDRSNTTRSYVSNISRTSSTSSLTTRDLVSQDPTPISTGLTAPCTAPRR